MFKIDNQYYVTLKLNPNKHKDLIDLLEKQEYKSKYVKSVLHKHIRK